MFPTGIWILLAVSLLLCSVGFKKFLWFITVGYGLSAAGIGAALLVMALIKGQFSWIFLLQCAVMIVYGVRLGGFLLAREIRNENHRKKLLSAGSDVKMPIPASVILWIFFGFLYLAQSAGPVYRFLNGRAGEISLLSYIGTALLALGFLWEAIADRQKSAAKEIDPDMPAMQGLYKLCRCPDYFGEILFWTGMILTGLPVFRGIGQWVFAVIGYICIWAIMLNGAKRVETRQIRNYGSKPEYNAYADKTPLLFPLIPFYHMTSPEKIAAEDAAKKAKKANR